MWTRKRYGSGIAALIDHSRNWVARCGEPVGYCEEGPGFPAVTEAEQEQAGGDPFDEGPLPDRLTVYPGQQGRLPAAPGRRSGGVAGQQFLVSASQGDSQVVCGFGDKPLRVPRASVLATVVSCRAGGQPRLARGGPRRSSNRLRRDTSCRISWA